jgi:hypothetical protein
MSARPRHGASVDAIAADDLTARGSGRRWWLVAIGVALLLVALSAAWVALRGYQAANSLRAARADLHAVESSLTAGDVAAARSSLVAAQAQTQRAESVTHDPVMSGAAALPVVGTTPAAVAKVSTIANTLSHGPLVELLAVGTALDPEKLRTAGDSIDLTALSAATPHLQSALTGLQAASSQLAALDRSFVPSQVSSRIADLTAQVDDVLGSTQSALTASQLLVPMLGASGERHYLLALQSNNELRGTGGFFGAWGILAVDHGKVTLQSLASNSVLYDQRYAKPPLDFGADYRRLYGDQPGTWTSANVSPNYPYGAQLWLKMYHDRTGATLDGVVTTDPVTLSYLLAVTGPVTLANGSTLTAADVVRYVESGVYRAHPHSDTRRNAAFQQVAEAAFQQLLSGHDNAKALVDALVRAAGERRLLVYSTHPDEQRLLQTTAVSGEIPQTPGPFAGMAVINASGNKLDYYLSGALRYDLLGCRPDGSRDTRITVTLTNSTPAGGAGLPLVVAERLDLTSGPRSPAHAKGGQDYDYLQVYGAAGARLISVQQDGKPIQAWTGAERGHPVYRIGVATNPQSTTVVTFDLVEPASSAPVRTFASPMVKSVPILADATQCPVG